MLASLWGMPLRGQQRYEFPVAVKPLVRTHWGQGFPFNLMCPQNKNGGEWDRNLAGCGSVAMAQIVNYHQYPSLSPDKKYVYNWDLMYRSREHNPTTDELISVAKLISDCGVSALTEYSEVGSSTSLSQMMGGLKRLFYYGDQLCIQQRDSFATPALDSLYRRLLFMELYEGRPVLYRGYDPKKKEGHLFIVDGCKGSKVHVNMGWGGPGDGYYDLDDLHGYSTEQWMLTEVADTTFRPDVLEVTLDQPGTLAQRLNEDEWMLTRHIRLSGPLDKADFATLRGMLQRGLLRTIDMAEAQVEAVPDSAFSDCRFLSYIALPSTAKRIGHAAFLSCRNLNHVDFSEGLEVIGRAAFCGCNNLLSLYLPSTLRQIWPNAFTSCEALLNVVLPDGVWRMGGYAFSYCAHLNSIVLPKALRDLGTSPFHHCDRLKRITLDASNPHYTVDGLEVKKK